MPATIPASTTTSTPATAANFIDPVALMHIQSLELRAKAVVEGFFNGLHRSPFHGFSVEFTEYRQYTPGDDPRHLDWRLYARSDRYYIKRFEDETNLRCHLLVDMSRSMSFGSLSHTKVDYARTLAASLAYFLSTQRDAVGLMTFDEQIDEYIPPRYRSGHLRRLLFALEKPVAGPSTDLSQPLEQIAERASKRGLLVLISDLLAPVDALQTNLGYLRARGHEVVLFQILDPAELTLNFDKPALFHDVESGREVYVDPAQARKTYQHRLEAHIAGIRQACDRLGVSYHRFATDQPLETALLDFLQSRRHGSACMTRRSGNTGRRPA
jgi:uncharacterized protein (DUF58 family)